MGFFRGAQNDGKMGRFYKSDRWFDGLDITRFYEGVCKEKTYEDHGEHHFE